MRHSVWILAWLCAAPAWGGVTIRCGDAERSFVFEEGIDDFYLNTIEHSNYDSISGNVRKPPSGEKFTVKIRIPRGGARGEVPACRFSSASPLVFECAGPEFMGSIDLVPEKDRPRDAVVASHFSLEAKEVRMARWDRIEEKLDRQSFLRLRYTTDARLGSAANEPMPPYRIDMDFPLGSCKTGEGIDTPAH